MSSMSGFMSARLVLSSAHGVAMAWWLLRVSCPFMSKVRLTGAEGLNDYRWLDASSLVCDPVGIARFGL